MALLVVAQRRYFLAYHRVAAQPRNVEMARLFVEKSRIRAHQLLIPAALQMRCKSIVTHALPDLALSTPTSQSGHDGVDDYY